MRHPLLLGLVALGPVDPEILRRLRTAIAKLLSLPALILPAKPLPAHTHHLGRNQHHSTRLLEYLLEGEYPELFRVLGITAVDLYIPIFTFVFGEAQLDGRAAIISMFRPGGGTDDLRPPRPVFLKRLIKLSLHELGHTFGLGHCPQEDCLMAFSTNLEKLDRKNLAFCAYCQVMLNDYFLDRGLEPRLRRYGETPALGAPSPIADSVHRRRR